MAKQKKLVVIDTYSLLHRAWHALPPTLTTEDGTPVNAVFGFSSILLKLMNDLKPDYIVAAFDLAEPTFRHEEYVEYKATRDAQPDELYDQVELIEQVLDSFKIPCLSKKGYEADDIIGTIATMVNKKHDDVKVVIVTGDLDALQLVNKNTEVFTMKRGINDTVTYDIKAVKERYEIKPDQVIDMKALKGDSSDNIPGVRGIGEKGAINLIKDFGSLDGIYKNIDSDKIKDRIRGLLTEQKKEAYQSQKLVTIVTDIPLNFKLADAKTHDFDRDEVYKLFRKLEFNTLLNKIPKQTGEKLEAVEIPQTEDVYKTITGERALKKLVSELENEKLFAIDTETTGINPIEAKLLGVCISYKAKHGYYISTREAKDLKVFQETFKDILEDPKIKKVGHNIKYDYQVLKKHHLTLEGISFDTMIAAYLLKPGRGLKLDDLAYAYFKRKMLSLQDISGQTKKEIDMLAIPEEKLAWYGAEDADFTYRLYDKLESEIVKADLEKLASEIEFPLIKVLAEMELEGVSIDQKKLKEMDKEFTKKVAAVSKKIYKLAGTEFNIASPLQLKEVLFEKLEIDTKGLKKSKTGISTAASELEKLKDRHEIIPLISEYRELAKLQSTYIKALPKLVSKEDNRIHTSFNQTIAATGRLSSTDPNLQNIPIRTEMGREIREAFISKRGYKLLSADYSQIELRLAAHISEDPAMVKSFKKGEDIHRATAAAINKIPMDKVTYNERRKAKEVNFGVLYGLGPVGLAQRTGITRDEARAFIDEYFLVYKGLQNYITETKERAHQLGYVETMFGRRRALPEIHSHLPQLVAAAERMAVNMPLQGGAADIMKLAMIDIFNKLPKLSKDSKMLIQVHDEIVFEVPDKDIKKVAKMVKETMESVTKLKVPLIADLNIGNNWAKMETLEL